jgi:hypothetical protein
LSLETTTEKSLLESKWVLVPIILASYVVAIFVIRPFVAEGWAWAVVDLTEVSFAAVGALVFALVARRFNWSSSKPGLIAILLSAGLVLLALGDSIWAYYESISQSPFPSLADAFYITAYLPFAIALLLNIRTIRMKFSQSMLILWVALSILAFVAITWFAIVPVAQTWTWPDTAVSLVYPFEDFVIIILALAILLKFSSGEIAKPWGLLVLGFILEAVGDLLYGIATNNNTYGLYDPSDLFLCLAYVTIIASGLFFVLVYRVHGGRKNA